MTACLSFFFFNDTATTEIYTLSLHDALPICPTLTAGGTTCISSRRRGALSSSTPPRSRPGAASAGWGADRKSTRLNSSHGYISYAVFCLKKKKTTSPDKAPAHSHRHRPPPTV